MVKPYAVVTSRSERDPAITRPAPAKAKRSFAGKLVPAILRKRPFLLFGVIFPTAMVTVYYLVFAAPTFVSESKFVVRLSSPPSQSPVGAILQNSGIARSQDDTFSVSDFLLSRDALRQLDFREPLHEIFASPKADFLTRYPRPWDSDSFEGLYRYYLSRIDVVHNSSTGITTLRTRAFSAQHAFDLNVDLLSAAGGLLVRLNDRAREDAVEYSRREVAEAEQKLLDVQDEITKYRNDEQMIDPTRVSVAMLDTIGRLSTELALARARRAEVETAAPESGAVPNLSNRIAALEDQIDKERVKLVGNDKSVSAHIAGYERLTLKREIVAKALALATASLESASADARRQRLYLEPIVQPNLPDEAIEPYGATHILVTFLLGAVISLLCWILGMAAAEHSQNRKLLDRFDPAVN
jgi:capsular polysaccharide transport system permease protein